MAHAETDHGQDFDIDLNTAREDELARVPMIGSQRAEALVARRPFKSWGDVIAVPGIDGGLVSALRDGGARLGLAPETHVHESSPEERSKPDWHGVDAEPETG
jgi:hypothetical protein